MNTRPRLDINMDYLEFSQYYYLKEELVAFCRQNGISTSGSKQELNKSIVFFLRTGEKPKVVKKVNKKSNIGYEITLDTIIEENFVCSEKHRAFFKSFIGESFKFNVAFQKYLKSASGMRYSDAVTKYYEIMDQKNKNKGNSLIDKQFEYNTYIRDFFNDNKGSTLKMAIACWKYKKSLKGHSRYEASDLAAIDK